MCKDWYNTIVYVCLSIHMHLFQYKVVLKKKLCFCNPFRSINFSIMNNKQHKPHLTKVSASIRQKVYWSKFSLISSIQSPETRLEMDDICSVHTHTFFSNSSIVRSVNVQPECVTIVTCFFFWKVVFHANRSIWRKTTTTTENFDSIWQICTASIHRCIDHFVYLFAFISNLIGQLFDAFMLH